MTKVKPYKDVPDGSVFRHMEEGIVCYKVGNSHAVHLKTKKDCIFGLRDKCVVYKRGNNNV